MVATLEKQKFHADPVRAWRKQNHALVSSLSLSLTLASSCLYQAIDSPTLVNSYLNALGLYKRCLKLKGVNEWIA